MLLKNYKNIEIDQIRYDPKSIKLIKHEYLKDNLKHLVVFSGCVFFYGTKFVRFSNTASRWHSYLNFIIAGVMFVISCIAVANT